MIKYGNYGDGPCMGERYCELRDAEIAALKAKGIQYPIHPRQAEILLNNYRVFIKRAQKTQDWDFKNDCIDAANKAAAEYVTITGKPILEDKHETGLY